MTLLLLALAEANAFTSLLGLQRKLDHQVRKQIFTKSGLTAEQASLLIELEGTLSFGAPFQSLADPDGCVGFLDLAHRLTLTSPGLSRRMSDLETRGWIEQRPVAKAAIAGQKRHGNSKRFIITATGRKRIAPVVRGLMALSGELFKGMTFEQRQSCYEIIEMLRERAEELARKKK